MIHESWHNIGRRIRYLRKTNHLTLKQLATGCDLSANAISLVERGEVAPSVATLCKIASALGVSASSLFQEVCTSEVVLRRAGRTDHESTIEQALETLTCSLAEPSSARVSSSRKTSFVAQSEQNQAARQSLLCLCGQVTFEADEQTYTLDPGDNLIFNGNALHRMQNCGGSTSVVIFVLPPENETATKQVNA